MQGFLNRDRYLKTLKEGLVYIVSLSHSQLSKGTRNILQG